MAEFLKKYHLVKALAEGSYGKVILAKCMGKDEGLLVAIKIFHFKENDIKSGRGGRPS